MDIDYNLLRTLPQDQAMAYLRERLAGGIGPVAVTQQGSDVDPTLWGAPGYDNGVTGWLAPSGDGTYQAPITRQFDPAYEGGQYGNYTGTFDREGKLLDVGFDKGERSGGWFSDNLETLGPLIVGGAMLGGATLGAGGLGGAGTAGGTGAGAGGTTLTGGGGVFAGGAPEIATLTGNAGTTALGSSLPQGLGTGTFGMNAAYTTPGLAALESGTLPALTQTGASVLGSTLPSASAIVAATPGLIPAAAPSFLEKLISKAGDKLLDKATDPVTLASLALAATGSGGGGTPTGTSGGMTMSPEQQAYYNRPTQSWDWDRLRQEAEAAGLSLPQYIARNWNTVSGGAFNRPVKMYEGGLAKDDIPSYDNLRKLESNLPDLGKYEEEPSSVRYDVTANSPAANAIIARLALNKDIDKNQALSLYAQILGLRHAPEGVRSVQPAGFGVNYTRRFNAGGYARGGEPGLGQVARLMRGGGSGRADTIPARLSDGEYVMDAETVAMLGDGSTDEGARRLDSMRQQVRAHKGRALSRGKISPDAKSPLTYMKGRK